MTARLFIQVNVHSLRDLVSSGNAYEKSAERPYPAPHAHRRRRLTNVAGKLGGKAAYVMVRRDLNGFRLINYTHNGDLTAN